jgi:Zn-dependent protease with chaperone function
MKNLLLNLIIFITVLLGSNYWRIWNKLGPSIVKDIFQRIKGKKGKLAKIKDREIEKFLKKLNYQDFYVLKSSTAFGMAHPLSKEVIVSSKIYESGNFNLIKYALAHEIAHKKQGNTKAGVIFFFSSTLIWFIAEYFFISLFGQLLF